MCSTFGNTADIYAIVHLVPHACQHNTVDQSHSSGASLRQIRATMCAGSSLKKKFNIFSLYRHMNYHDALRSPFVANFLNVSRPYE